MNEDDLLPPEWTSAPVEETEQLRTDAPMSRIVPLASLYREAIQEAHNPLPAEKIAGFPMLNQLFGGFRMQEYSILCGLTGLGKTACLANFTRGLMINQVPHAVFSVETGPKDYIRRVIGAFSGININQGDAIPAGILANIERKYGEVLNQPNNYLALYEDRFSVKTLMSEIKHCIDSFGVKVVFIDNLNFFLEASSGDRMIETMDKVTHDLVIFSKSNPVHIVMVMHPRKVEEGRIESEFDIKGSSTAVQEAHNVLLFNPPHPDLISKEIARPYMRELKIQKCRRKGVSVGARVLFTSDGDGSRYQEYGVYHRGKFERSPEAPPVPGRGGQIGLL